MYLLIYYFRHHFGDCRPPDPPTLFWGAPGPQTPVLGNCRPQAKARIKYRAKASYV